MAGLTRKQRAERAAAKAAHGESEAPRVAVLERRLQNPFGQPAAPVRLKDKTLFPRWFNSASRPDAFWVAGEKGWTGVTPEMIIDLRQIGNYTRSPEGYVARGERAQEVLMCMPKEYWDRLQLAKTRENLAMMRDSKGEQSRALEAASKKLGPEVAESMEAVTRTMTVHDNYERVERTNEAE